MLTLLDAAKRGNFNVLIAEVPKADIQCPDVDVRFTPESGHWRGWHNMSANSHKRTFASLLGMGLVRQLQLTVTRIIAKHSEGPKAWISGWLAQ